MAHGSFFKGPWPSLPPLKGLWVCSDMEITLGTTGILVTLYLGVIKLRAMKIKWVFDELPVYLGARVSQGQLYFPLLFLQVRPTVLLSIMVITPGLEL